MDASESISMDSQTSKKDFWFRHVDLQISSSMGRKAYCRQNNLNYCNFVYWSNKYAGNQQDSPELVAVQIKPANDVSTEKILCTLNLNNGQKLQIHDLITLAVILDRAR